jgi:hypothetical protein
LDRRLGGPHSGSGPGEEKIGDIMVLVVIHARRCPYEVSVGLTCYGLFINIVKEAWRINQLSLRNGAGTHKACSELLYEVHFILLYIGRRLHKLCDMASKPLKNNCVSTRSPSSHYHSPVITYNMKKLFQKALLSKYSK